MYRYNLRLRARKFQLLSSGRKQVGYLMQRTKHPVHGYA